MKNIKGLILVIILSVLSMVLNDYLPAIETLTIGIVLGVIAANVFNIPESFNPGINYALKKILKWGIVLLGVKLNFSLILELGVPLFIMIILLMTIALLVANVIGKKFGLNRHVSTLIGVGSSICGASAIVAMSPVINADEEDTAIAVATISLLGAIGVFLYSFIAGVTSIGAQEFGIWSGSTLQGVSHALAAAGAKGDLSLEIATLVKMTRVALLAPVAIVIGSQFKSGTTKVKFPKYVLWFIVVGIITTLNTEWNIVPTTFNLLNNQVDVLYVLKKLSSFFILMAMISMGIKVNFKNVDRNQIKVLALGVMVFAIISTLGLGYIYFVL